jgi:methyltransferase (TIGR00027 family)
VYSRALRTAHYVACDFERESLEQTLQAHGFASPRASIWIWEGVTMYLSEAAIASSLDAIARLSAQHSRIALTSLEPVPAGARRKLFALATGVLAAASQPIRSTFEPADMARLLKALGFSTLSDERPRDIAARHALRSLQLGFGAPNERVAVAGRHASS